MATQEEMDTAAVFALEEFDRIWVALSEPQREGAKSIITWLKYHYRRAGYKRMLSRGIFKREL